MTEKTDAVEFETGSWQEALKKSTDLLNKSKNDRKKSTTLLWSGARAGIVEWATVRASDTDGETLYNKVIEALGRSRKGDASKIRTVALASRDNGLNITDYKSLTEAYAAAVRLRKTEVVEAEEDTAADEAVSEIAKTAPKTAGTPESAAQLLLSKGLDETARILLDALGADNHKAHRALLRAMVQEVGGRAKPEEKKAGNSGAEKPGAEKATERKATPKATVKSGQTKAKTEPAKAKAEPAKAKATPKATVKAEPVKAEPVKDEPVKDEPAAKKRAVPVVRR